jgi:hypothetical protein
VTWIDCLAKGKSLAHRVLMLGEHVENGLEFEIKNPISVPFYTPSALLNSVIMKTFNGAYWNKANHNKVQIVSPIPFVYLLNIIYSWNNSYGNNALLVAGN